MWRKKRVLNTGTPPRHITVFSTAAGTPSGSLPLVGGKIGDGHLGKYLPLGLRIDHWGILVEGQHGSDSTFFELYRPGGGIGVLRRSRFEREREEGGEAGKKLYATSDSYTFETWPGIQQMQRESQQKDKCMNLKYTSTGSLTKWTDDEIEECAKEICKTHMRDEYHLWKANCQTFVNLLLQRIVEGSVPFIPYSTASHALGSGPSEQRLSMLTDFDKTKPMELKGSPVRITPHFMLLRAKHNIPLLVYHDLDRPLDSPIDLGLGSDDTKRPLTVADVRNSARFQATNRTGHPILSLEAIRSYWKAQDAEGAQIQQDDQDAHGKQLEEGFQGDQTPVIVSDRNGEEKLFFIGEQNVWKARPGGAHHCREST